MELRRGSQLITVPKHPKLLVEFNFHQIAFVMGLSHPKFQALCVTNAGEYFYSEQTPEALCRNLEARWQDYYLNTRRQYKETWEQVYHHALESWENKLGQLKNPLRVASCGKHSFWSADPANPYGIWFFTPGCEAIEIEHGKLHFMTHSANDQVISWTAQPKTGEKPLVSPLQLSLLMDYVSRKALIVYTYAIANLGNKLDDLDIELPPFHPTPVAPQFPIRKWFFDQDIDATYSFLIARSGGEGGAAIEALANKQEEKDKAQEKRAEKAKQKEIIAKLKQMSQKNKNK
ncbi:hypothetical protein [Lacticaseibacillus porcinae]|uniref:hypothetical protein n=1 Tax=Lacticaseibacillus porcinae TaxID=1123687 RepID=UPI000F79C029|nr:hypothetical protein [Lacticaseibacillus porcinae]